MKLIIHEINKLDRSAYGVNRVALEVKTSLDGPMDFDIFEAVRRGFRLKMTGCVEMECHCTEWSVTTELHDRSRPERGENFTDNVAVKMGSSFTFLSTGEVDPDIRARGVNAEVSVAEESTACPR